eukprot:TRINITY_DN1667_c0_g1_i3.p1 TRINITY_DN1667_c0_g1~~TRINITY_DN1667_c0_g1_i3.p1  ORF type:complete len:125 (+),score=35.25 TRINITY_DN1667_c0_g1_i3:171-545(+)
MEPAFQRGDLLFLTMSDEPFTVGEIVVFKIQGKEIPIVHRILKIHEQADGTVKILTKGDANDRDDAQGIYAYRQSFLGREHIIGRAKAYMPLVGMVTIIMNEEPKFKYALIGILGLFALSSREK